MEFDALEDFWMSNKKNHWKTYVLEGVEREMKKCGNFITKQKTQVTKTLVIYLIYVQDITIKNMALDLVEEYNYRGQLRFPEQERANLIFTKIWHILLCFSTAQFTQKSGCLLPEINRVIKLAWKVFEWKSIIFKSRMLSLMICRWKFDSRKTYD